MGKILFFSFKFVLTKGYSLLYKNRIVKAGFSAVQHIDQEIRYVNDKGKEVVEYPEWICEAYMETDYSKLTDDDFQRTLNNYLAFLVKEGKVYETCSQ